MKPTARELRREHLDRERVLSAYAVRLADRLARDPELGRHVAEGTELPPGTNHDPLTDRPRESERARMAKARRSPGGSHKSK